jgi:hypothetical protein
LTKEDGLYGVRLDEWRDGFTDALLEPETLIIPAERAAIAIYRAEEMGEFQELEGEFVYFKHPEAKVRALAGVLHEVTTSDDALFQRLPLAEKFEFVEARLDGLCSDPLTLDFIKDLELLTTPGSLMMEPSCTEDMSERVRRLEQTHHALQAHRALIHSYEHQLDMARENPRVRHFADFVLRESRKRLSDSALDPPVPDVYRPHYEELVRRAERIVSGDLGKTEPISIPGCSS